MSMVLFSVSSWSLSCWNFSYCKVFVLACCHILRHNLFAVISDEICAFFVKSICYFAIVCNMLLLNGSNNLDVVLAVNFLTFVCNKGGAL